MGEAPEDKGAKVGGARPFAAKRVQGGLSLGLPVRMINEAFWCSRKLSLLLGAGGAGGGQGPEGNEVGGLCPHRVCAKMQLPR